ncbi:MAG TPA: DUF4134 family protein [Pedobacter sp.]|nr:DUF4134 family protein [Pedobacter sp.]
MFRIVLLCVFFALFALVCWPAAAQPGIAEIQQATGDLRRSFFSARDATLVLAAIFGICGGLRVYYNWQMGKERINTEVAAWFFVALFMVLLGPFVQTLFGI